MVKGKMFMFQERIKKIWQDIYEKYSLLMPVKSKSTIFSPNVLK